MGLRIARLACLIVLLASVAVAAGESRQVAITIDDLPRGGDGGPGDLAGVSAMTIELLRPFREQRIPVIGFVNAGRSKLDSSGMQDTLKLWLDAGADLGNHSYSHLDINSVALEVYTDDIVRGEAAMSAVTEWHRSRWTMPTTCSPRPICSLSCNRACVTSTCSTWNRPSNFSSGGR